MNAAITTLEPFDCTRADAADLAAVHTFTRRLRAELSPSIPAAPLEQTVTLWRMAARAGHVSVWIVREPAGGSVVARGRVAFPRTRENLRVASGHIEVLRDHRRRGLARALAAAIAGVLRREDRPVLLATTLAVAPGGAALMQRVGARRARVTAAHTAWQADLAAIEAWLAGPPRS